MTVADFDALTPTAGSPANSFEYGVDVQIGGVWLNIPDIVDLVPTFTPKTRPRATYAHKGKRSQRKYAEDVDLAFNIEAVRNNAGQYQPVLQALLDISALNGEANIIPVRFYDQRGADFAYGGRASIEARGRTGTGADESAWFAVSMVGESDFAKISNPQLTNAKPAIASVSPSGAATGATVLIQGVGFTGVTGATGVKFGGTNATSYNVLSNTQILAVLPSGSAGVVPVLVTHPTNGASDAVNYTRAA